MALKSKSPAALAENRADMEDEATLSFSGEKLSGFRDNITLLRSKVKSFDRKLSQELDVLEVLSESEHLSGQFDRPALGFLRRRLEARIPKLGEVGE